MAVILPDSHAAAQTVHKSPPKDVKGHLRPSESKIVIHPCVRYLYKNSRLSRIYMLKRVGGSYFLVLNWHLNNPTEMQT